MHPPLDLEDKMAIRKLTEDILAVGVQDWDRRSFDEFMELPDGTSYNSFIVRGTEKTALIDTSDPDKYVEYFINLEDAGLTKLDYIVANHGEQDHSGLIPDVLERFPDAMVVTNAKCKGILLDHLQLSDDKFIVVGDNETLDLGGRTLQFILAPWVHWPDTMFTYVVEEKVLFTCDFLGSHLATTSLFVQDPARTLMDARRYFAEIMMPFSRMIPKYLARIREINPDIIAPSHGPAYNDPEFILDAYEKWVSGPPDRVVLIPYVSMHNSTKMMVDYLVDQLTGMGLDCIPMNLAKCDIGQFAVNLVESAAVVFATPTFLVGPHPFVLQAAIITGLLKPKTRVVGFMGSFGWGSKAMSILKDQLKMVKANFLEPVMAKGMPGDDTFNDLNEMARQILEGIGDPE